MGKLNLHIGKVTPENNGLIDGIAKDSAILSDYVSSAAAKVLTPVDTVAENTIHTLRHPGTLFQKEAYKKLAKFLPYTVAHIITSTLDKPFATVEKALEYGINNNLERTGEWLKGISTKFLADLITDKGKTSSKIAKGLGTGIEGLGDITTSTIKAPFWLVQKGLNLTREKITNPANNWTYKNTKNQRLNPNEDYIKTGLMNSKSFGKSSEELILAA